MYDDGDQEDLEYREIRALLRKHSGKRASPAASSPAAATPASAPVTASVPSTPSNHRKPPVRQSASAGGDKACRAGDRADGVAVGFKRDRRYQAGGDEVGTASKFDEFVDGLIMVRPLPMAIYHTCCAMHWGVSVPAAGQRLRAVQFYCPCKT